ncbi:MAG: hypothetical protein M3O22_05325 [Pseudomonadota bacterium]|nr:hypothetical protein [Pseudomonadota bacterium]
MFEQLTSGAKRVIAGAAAALLLTACSDAVREPLKSPPVAPVENTRRDPTKLEKDDPCRTTLSDLAIHDFICRTNMANVTLQATSRVGSTLAGGTPAGALTQMQNLLTNLQQRNVACDAMFQQALQKSCVQADDPCQAQKKDLRAAVAKFLGRAQELFSKELASMEAVEKAKNMRMSGAMPPQIWEDYLGALDDIAYQMDRGVKCVAGTSASSIAETLRQHAKILSGKNEHVAQVFRDTADMIEKNPQLTTGKLLENARWFTWGLLGTQDPGAFYESHKNRILTPEQWEQDIMEACGCEGILYPPRGKGGVRRYEGFNVEPLP